jgi:hypothetical protein
VIVHVDMFSCLQNVFDLSELRTKAVATSFVNCSEKGMSLLMYDLMMQVL